jgi:hypothetical protein
MLRRDFLNIPPNRDIICHLLMQPLIWRFSQATSTPHLPQPNLERLLPHLVQALQYWSVQPIMKHRQVALSHEAQRDGALSNLSGKILLCSTSLTTRAILL